MKLRHVIVAFVALAYSWPLTDKLIEVGPQHTVASAHPNVCFHTRLTDEVETIKIQKTLALVREAGATAIVEYFPWAYVEAEQGQYNWYHADRIIDIAHQNGITVIARIGVVPAWARYAPTEPIPSTGVDRTDTYLPPERYEDYANYIAAFTERYQDRVDYVIAWNEPNLALEWGFRQVDPEEHVALLKAAYAGAKRGNPNVNVLGGAVAPTLEPVGSPNGMHDLTFLERMYAAGFADTYDILAIHAYGLGQPHAQAPDPQRLNYRRVEVVRDLMVANGDGHKQVAITESGWNDSSYWLYATNPADRITQTLGSYAYAEENWPWNTWVCSWAFRYPQRYYSYFDQYAFVAPDFEPLPIYLAIKDYTQSQ